MWRAEGSLDLRNSKGLRFCGSERQNRAPDSCRRQGQNPPPLRWVPTRFPPCPPTRPRRVSVPTLTTALQCVLLAFDFLKQSQILSLNLTFACATPAPSNTSLPWWIPLRPPAPSSGLAFPRVKDGGGAPRGGPPRHVTCSRRSPSPWHVTHLQILVSGHSFFLKSILLKPNCHSSPCKLFFFNILLFLFNIQSSAFLVAS